MSLICLINCQKFVDFYTYHNSASYVIQKKFRCFSTYMFIQRLFLYEYSIEKYIKGIKLL